MYRTKLAILLACLVLLPFSIALPAQTTISIGELDVAIMKVAAITPEFEGPNILRLTAKLKGTPQDGCPVTWQFKGPSHGYAFHSTKGASVTLTVGALQTRVTVEACVSCRGKQGGCAEITLNADVLENTQDVAAWMEIKISDFSEPGFICQRLGDDQYRYVFYDVASRVNTVTGEYYRDKEDLGVKVPGGRLSVHRWYQGGRWTWDHERHDLTLVRGPEGAITTVKKGEVPYRSVSEEEEIFTDGTYGTYRIWKTDTGYRWESKQGEWKRYNPEGRLIAFGDRNGVIGRVLFRNGRPFCLSDRNNRAVLWMEYDDAGFLRAAYDLTGRGVTYRYRNDLLSAVNNVSGNETHFAYDKEGRLKEVLEPEGEEVHIIYDDFGHVASVLDAQGKGHTFTWDYDQEVSLYYVRIQDPAGKVTEIWSNKEGQARRVNVNGRTVHKIEKQGRALIVTDARGLLTKKTFDERGNLLEVVYPDSSVVRTEYESKYNRPVKKINENGVETHYGYDENGDRIRMVEAVGTPAERITEYTYDRDGNLLSARQVRDESTQEAITRFTYDVSGNRTSSTDPEGHTTRYTYDAQGNVLTKTDPTGALWRYAYDTAGRMTASIDPLNQETRYCYDAEGRKIREVDPKGNETRHAYDEKGNMVRQTDALGNTTRFEYNASGKLTRQIDPEGKEIRFGYDTQSRMLSQVDGEGNETRMVYETPTPAECPMCGGGTGTQPDRIVYPTFTKEFTYDQRGRKTKETDVLSDTEAFTTFLEYDSVGNLSLKKDNEGRATAYVYDSLDRLIKVTDPLGNERRYAYDDRDNLIALTDANGNTTLFAYDSNNRLVREARPMGEETTYAYDGAGNLVEKVDAKGQRTIYKYDKAGRLMSIQYFSETNAPVPVKTVAFTYDELGNLLSYDDGETSGLYTYDAVSRKTEEMVDYGPFSKAISYEYYRNGRKRAFTGPDGIRYTYTYDDAYRLAAIEIPKLGTVTYTGYRWTRPTMITLPGGTTKLFEYDPFMRIKRITSRHAARGTILDYRYSYDRMNNIMTKQTEHGTYHYRYDLLDQLIEAKNPVRSDEAFAYDSVGNHLASADSSGKCRYNSNNQLVQCDGTNFLYDDNGNMVRKTGKEEVIQYICNEENRLIMVKDKSGNIIAEYDYDPFGKRLWKEVDGERTFFVYSEEGLVGECNAAGDLTRSYGYVPDSAWMTDPLYLKVAGDYYYYQADHLGSPQKLTSKGGSEVWSAEYASFGEVNLITEVIRNNLRFPGQYLDIETDFCYNYHRYYLKSIGRYYNQDPLRCLDEMTHYNYAHNNPINKFDNLGLKVLATCTLESLGEFGAGAILNCLLQELTCYKCKRNEADYDAKLLGLSAGVPYSKTKFTVLLDVFDMSYLDGKAIVITGTVAIRKGVSLGQICIGKCCSDFEFSPVETENIDISASGLVGDGKLSNRRQTSCCEE